MLTTSCSLTLDYTFILSNKFKKKKCAAPVLNPVLLYPWILLLAFSAWLRRPLQKHLGRVALLEAILCGLRRPSQEISMQLTALMPTTFSWWKTRVLTRCGAYIQQLSEWIILGLNDLGPSLFLPYPIVCFYGFPALHRLLSLGEVASVATVRLLISKAGSSASICLSSCIVLEIYFHIPS